jgi:hypothetical protein
MRRGVTRAVVISALMGAVAAVIPATSALAINRATPCPRSDYMEYFNSFQQAVACYANAGTANVSLGDIRGVSAGNNSGYFVYSPGFTVPLCFGCSVNESPNSVTVIQVHIN